MKKAFTLIELLVVIAIIATLAGIFMSTFGSSRESALSARCLSNMKNLANAVSSYALASSENVFPPAESVEGSYPDISEGMKHAKLKYSESRGWISWYSEGLYPSDSSQKSKCRTISLYSTVSDDVRYAIERGALFSHTSGNRSTYLCPKHKKLKPQANWSYFMNPNAGGAGYGKKISANGRSVGAEHVLLFAEIPFQGPGDWFPDGSEGNEETDAVIQYAKENIGCNHKSGKDWVAHIVFCDGHVEKLRADKGTKSESGSAEASGGINLRELTEWLCEGYDVVYKNGTYQQVKDAAEEEVVND